MSDGQSISGTKKNLYLHLFLLLFLPLLNQLTTTLSLHLNVLCLIPGPSVTLLVFSRSFDIMPASSLFLRSGVAVLALLSLLPARSHAQSPSSYTQTFAYSGPDFFDNFDFILVSSLTTCESDIEFTDRRDQIRMAVTQSKFLSSSLLYF